MALNRLATLILPLAGLAACTTAQTAGSPETTTPPAASDEVCDAAKGQSFIGWKATEVTGEAIVTATGARTLRWGPPGAVFTMDYRQDRVNVMYDEAMTITEVRCG